MKINKVDKILQVYNTQNIKKTELAKGNGKKDELKLSEKAIEFQNAVNSLKDIPDIRKDKVEKIKHEIKTGTYKVDGEKIVEKMMGNISFDKRA
ncbi:flagellar biosynthesis anti-sigma factor FlgM [Anaerosalibacter sp. Marseille-P3206]|uniref:flagellar biosynthesis anti-sigma factor FlgM n=1 Tax=Anaerosalibacter sp. Marseille-P3206 TaxID=1871005 RepID=UPI0009854E8F|nr:flagellar biosynthesis anti-sigma factor FlgM [Anaerosalibacter sp. Marseille-P3206]